MEQRLKEAAQAGDTNALYALIREHPYILKIVDETPFVDTPLHIAAYFGHTHFAVEVASLWPSFGKKLNPNGFSAIHLAVLNGHTETVKRLISIDSELIRVHGKERTTPLHCAAEMGNVDLLAEFLCACPESIEDLNVRCESALHVSMTTENLEALKVMLGFLHKRDGSRKVLNSTDENGNTLLHIAASMNQPQVVKLLLDHKVSMNAKNLNGLTALDIVFGLPSEKDNSEILAILNRKKARRGSSIPTFQSLSGVLSSKVSFVDNLLFWLGDIRRDLSVERRNMVLVVAVLIATATYQCVITPPSGLFEGYANIFNATNTTSTAAPMEPPFVIDSFMCLNTLAFGNSIIVMLLVLEIRIYSAVLHISLLCLFASYNSLLSVGFPPKMLTHSFCLWQAYLILGGFIYSCKCVFRYSDASDHHCRQMRRMLDIRRDSRPTLK